jgi:DNA invertase Pin-like site-specific DNA recombinase
MRPRCLIYCRQSVSDSDETLSLDSQSAALRRWATDQGWQIVGELRDWNERGWDDARPGLAEAIRLATTRAYDLLVIWSIDRLARSVRILENTLHELAPYGIELRSFKEPWANQPMFRQILAAVAEQQTRDMAAHVRRALIQRAQRGHHHGRVPFGYQRDPATKKLLPHSAFAPIARELFERYTAGDSVSELARDLIRRRVPTMRGGLWEPVTIQTILTNPVYTGRVRFGSVLVEDAHPAIVSDELWQRTQDRKASYGSHRRKAVSSWLEGRIRHACGGKMYLTTCGRRDPEPTFLCGLRQGFSPRGPDGARLKERCAVHPGRVRQSYAERHAWMVIVRAVHALLPPEVVIANLEREHAELAPAQHSEREEWERRRQQAVERRHRAEELYLNGQRDRLWFAAEETRMQEEIARCDARLAELPAAVDHDALFARHLSLAQLADRIDDIAPTDRGLVLAELGGIVLGPGRNLNPSVHLAPDQAIVPFLPERLYQ